MKLHVSMRRTIGYAIVACTMQQLAIGMEANLSKTTFLASALLYATSDAHKDKISDYYSVLEEHHHLAQRYFQDYLIIRSDLVDEFYELTKIRIQSLDLKHIFQAGVNRRRTISGYHSTLFQNCIHELITTPDTNKCYEIKAKIADQSGKLVINRKSMFPDNWSGIEIVNAFFDLLERKENLTIIPKNSGALIESILDNQPYKFFVESSGKVATFFPRTASS